MNTPAATVTSTWAFVPPTSAMPYSTRITKAFLKTLSFIAPRNCVTNSGRKRRERSRTISGWRIGRSLRKATGGDHRHALSKRSLTYCREIGRAHVRTPVTNAHLVCRLLLEKKKYKKRVHGQAK